MNPPNLFIGGLSPPYDIDLLLYGYNPAPFQFIDPDIINNVAD